VNNAGLVHEFPHFTEEDPESYDRQLAIHARGTYLVTRAAWPHLAASRAGRIVSTSSTRGLFAGLDGTAYSAAKEAVVGLTRAYAADGAQHGIRANAILSFAWTRMAQRGEDTPLGARLKAMPSDPAQVAKLVVWLAHSSCELNGELFTVGVGRVAKVFIGVTEGIFDPDATPESLRDRYAEIAGESGYFVPRDNAEEIKPFFANFAS